MCTPRYPSESQELQLHSDVGTPGLNITNVHRPDEVLQHKNVIIMPKWASTVCVQVDEIHKGHIRERIVSTGYLP